MKRYFSRPSLHRRLALILVVQTVAVLLLTALALFLVLRSFLKESEERRLETLVERVSVHVPDEKHEALALKSDFPSDVHVRLLQQGEVVAATPDFPNVPLDAPTGYSIVGLHQVLSREVRIRAGAKEPTELDLPAEFRSRNVMVEAVAAGLRKTQAYYANTLKVQVVENYGQVVVNHASTGKAVPGAYVKVYARRKNGEVKFFKDGYTDLLGRFDYASLNTNEMEDTERLALLVLSPEFGAVVREASPPKQ